MIPRRYLLVIVTFLLSVLLYVDRICISTAKDPIATDLRLSDKQMGWVLSAFALGYALCQTPSGLLADRFGPRRVLAAVVSFWSLFTGLTAAAWNFLSMFVVRLLFGAGEAGAFPSMARAVYSWIPMKERGVVQGINFSGSRIGAAFALPVVAGMIQQLGWKGSFCVLMAVGWVWAVIWYWWFRDDPTEHRGVSAEEREYILKHRQQTTPAEQARGLSAMAMLRSKNLWLAMAQYFCSNFTFFFCLTWLYPHIKKTYGLGSVEAGFYASAPLLAGAVGNVFSGGLVDWIYRRGHWTASRRVPAMLGFALAAIGLVASVFMDTPGGAVAWLAVAIFGADMTLSPSWSFCIDIGRRHAGAISGTMNMAGNIGSFVTSLAFPYLLAWTKDPHVFFFVGALLNLLAVVLWGLMRPQYKLEEY